MKVLTLIFVSQFLNLGTHSFDIESNETSVNTSVIMAVNHYFSNTLEVSVIDETGCDYSWLTPPKTSYKDFRYKPPQIRYGSLTGYLAHRGFMICLNSSSYQAAFWSVKVRNPTSRIVLYMTTLPPSLGPIFDFAWRQLKLINVMLASPAKAYLYNPYNQSLLAAVSETLIDRFCHDIYHNMQLYPMKVNKFYSIQICDVAVADPDDPQYIAVCGEVLDMYRRAMNFSVVYVPPHDIDDFGYIADNGTYLGALGEIEYDRADVSVGLRLITNFNTSQNIYFLHAIFEIKYQFVVPVNFYRVQFEVMPHKFMSYSVLILICVVVTLLICLHYLSEFCTLPFIQVALIYISTYANTSIAFRPRFSSTRLVYSMILLLALIVSSIYTGTIITNLNKAGGSSNIQSLDQMLRTGLQIRVPSGPDRYLRDFEFFPSTSVQNRLFKKMEVTETSSEIQIHYAAIERTAAIMVPNHFMFYYQSKFLSNQTGKTMIHNIPENSYGYYMSVMLQKSSPFIERFNYITLRTIEGFLHRNQYNLGRYKMETISIRRARDGFLHEETVKLIGLKEVETLFLYYLIALAASVVVFALELVVYKIERRLEIRRLTAKVRTHQADSCEICFYQGFKTIKKNH